MRASRLPALLIACLVLAPVAIGEDHGGDPPRGPPDEPGGGPPEDRGGGRNGPGGRDNGAGGNESADEDVNPQGNGRGNAPRGPPDERGGRPEDAGNARAKGLQRANERRAAADARPVSETMGAFTVQHTEQKVAGRYVAFEYGAFNLTNVTADGLPLFDVEARPSSPQGSERHVEPEVRGVRLQLDASGYNARVHDNPGAVFRFSDAPGLTFTFPNGTALTAGERRVDVLYDTGETAHLVSGSFTVNGTTVAALDERATFVLGAKRGAFDKHRPEITNAIAESRVGAEVTVIRDAQAGTAAEDAVTFGNVTVATNATEGNVTLVVQGTAMDGRVIVANVEPAFFEAASAEDLNVLFDGMPAERADNLLHVLNAPEGGENALYWVVEDADGYQVIFALPHYSVHTLSILDAVEQVPPSVVAGLVASVIVVAAGGFVLFRRR